MFPSFMGLRVRSLAAVSGAFACAISTAQNRLPTMSDTSTWLTNMYASHGSFDLTGGVHQQASVALQGCHARVYVETTNARAASGFDRSVVSEFDLGRMDPSRATPHMNYEKTSAAMVLRTWDGAQSIKSVSTASDAAPRVEMRSEVNVPLPLDGYTRVAKAWIHAIELCGGKPSAF